MFRGFSKVLFGCLSICFANFCHAGLEIHPHGYWFGDGEREQHAFDASLAQKLVQFLHEEHAGIVVDFGCGCGDYMKMFLESGIDCRGYDGNPDTYKISGCLASTLDLSHPVHLGQKFDWVISLEVGEHLPKEFESTFIDNLHKYNTKGIVLSWAIPGQGGFGHFNEQPNAYIKRIMKRLGYKNDVEAEEKLRQSATLSWFKNTIMVFRKT